MSFLYRATPTIRLAASSSIRPSPRLFSTAVIYQKSATETVKDGLKAVDRTVSDIAVAGIDKGVEIKDAAASVVGANASKAEGEAKGTAEELTGKAKGKAAELKGEAKGKYEEVKGQL